MEPRRAAMPRQSAAMDGTWPSSRPTNALPAPSELDAPTSSCAIVTEARPSVSTCHRPAGSTTGIPAPLGSAVMGNTSRSYPSGTTLVADDRNNLTDVFVHHLVTATTVRVSVPSAGGEATGSSFRSFISGDGRFVAFESEDAESRRSARLVRGALRPRPRQADDRAREPPQGEAHLFYPYG